MILLYRNRHPAHHRQKRLLT